MGADSFHSCPETLIPFLFPIGLSQVPLNGEEVPGTSHSFGSRPSVLSVPQSNWEFQGHPEDSNMLVVLQSHWEFQGLPPLGVVLVSCLSHTPTGSPWDIPRTPGQFSQCPVCLKVPLGVSGTSQGFLPLGVSCLFHILSWELLGHLMTQCLNIPASQAKHDRLKLEVTPPVQYNKIMSYQSTWMNAITEMYLIIQLG